MIDQRSSCLLPCNGNTTTLLDTPFTGLQTGSTVDRIDLLCAFVRHSGLRLLSRLNLKILLGLTATPERADGQSVLEWFDGRIANETVLRNLNEAVRNTRTGLVGDLRALGPGTRLSDFMRDAGAELNDVYARPGLVHDYPSARTPG